MAGVDYIEPTIVATASQAAPASGVPQAQLTVGKGLRVGVYEVEIFISLTGTAETQLRNLRFTVNGVVSFADDLPTLSGTTQKITLKRLEVTDPTQNLYIYLAANATAGSIYNTQIVATRIK